MTCQLKIHHTLSTIPSRNINNIMVLFSLTSKLNITINGETKDVTGWLISPRSLDAYNYIGTMKKERILVLDLLKKHLEKAGK